MTASCPGDALSTEGGRLMVAHSRDLGKKRSASGNLSCRDVATARSLARGLLEDEQMTKAIRH